jgi:glycine cleavage system transcriptional repressor
MLWRFALDLASIDASRVAITMSKRIVKELPGANVGNETRQQVVDNYLLVSASASADMQLLSVLGKRAVDAGCNLLEARVSILGREVCVLLLAGGAWDAVAKFENALTRLAREEQIQLQVKRTGARTLAGTALPYAIEVIAADRPGVLYALSDFFARRGVIVETLNSSRYKAAQTGADMFSATLSIGVPSSMHIAGLRDDFLEFCDAQNLDAILEPIKG